MGSLGTRIVMMTHPAHVFLEEHDIMSTDLIYARENAALIDTLLKRRSASAKAFSGPGPSPEQVETLLKIAARVPDHGKLNPWWFITFEGNARLDFGKAIRAAWSKRDENATPAKLDDEEKRLLRAPLVIAVVSRPRPSTIPVWEQVLSAGAACHNLCLAANAMGFGANWLTEWYAFDAHVRAAMTLDARDHIAGFIYIGTPAKAPDERDRPDLAKLVNAWPQTANRGDNYDKTGLGYEGVPGFSMAPFSN